MEPPGNQIATNGLDANVHFPPWRHRQPRDAGNGAAEAPMKPADFEQVPFGQR
jgi:hypothetical protein